MSLLVLVGLETGGLKDHTSLSRKHLSLLLGCLLSPHYIVTFTSVLEKGVESKG